MFRLKPCVPGKKSRRAGGGRAALVKSMEADSFELSTKADSDLTEPRTGHDVPAVRSAHWWTHFSLNDVITTVYLLGLNLALLIAPDSPQRSKNQLIYGSLFAGYLATVSLVRSSVLPQWLTAFVYRTLQFGILLGTYLLFRDFLPVVNERVLDLDLYQLDLKLFGTEPALWVEPYQTPALTEWFSFFYYGYFILMAVHIFPIVYLSRDHDLIARFGLGMTVAATVGHTIYMLVPGFGPYKALADEFQRELSGGFWLHLVLSAVEAGGAQKDIFPSMHTCFPSFVVIYSFYHRERFPFRYTWPIVAFFVINIIGATMYLRWHYLIDIVAGLALASFAAFVAIRGTAWESARRAQRNVPRVWPSWR